MKLAEKIRRLRAERGLTQDQLGEQVRIHGRHISRYENGHANPSDATIQRIAVLFGVPFDDLKDDGRPLPVAAGPAGLDQELSSRLPEIARLPAEEKKALLLLVDALITRHRITAALKPAG